MSTTTKLGQEQTAARPSRLPATFRALRHHNYRVWFIGQGISLVGTWMQTMAQQVLVYNLTGSAAALGIINFIGLIPLLPLSLWSGSITDRLPKRAIILACQVVMLVQAVVLGYLATSGRVQLWHVYVLAFLLSAANAVDLPARQAFTVDMVTDREDLTNAIALNSAMFNGARAIGPALAGLVVAAVGEGQAFYLNALTFVAVIISLAMMRSLPRPAAPSGSKVSTLEHIGGGLRYMRKQPTILALVSLIAVSAFLSMPYNTLMPVFASDILGESAQPLVNLLCFSERAIMTCQSPEALPLGLLMTGIGLGALIGALLVASLPPGAPRGLLLTAGNLAFPLALVLFAASRSFTLSLLFVLLTGFAFVWQNALANTILQLATPDEMRGRVMSLYTLTFQATMRLGGLQAGLVSDWLGAPLSLGIGALASLVYGAYIAVRYPAIRKFT